MNRKNSNRLILFASILLLGIGLYGIVPHLFGYIQGASTYQDLAQFAQTTETKPAPAANPAPGSERTSNESADAAKSETTTEPVLSFPVVDFAELARINPEINGWIVIDDTRINYPTVKGTDNVYYLNHMFDHKKNAAGSIFMDFENAGDYSDFHSIIYGHHMKNGSMFADIEKYKSQDFYNSHPQGKLITPNKNYKIHFVAGYVANVMENAWELEFPDEEHKAKWIAECIGKSDFKSLYTPKEGDTFLTLSTCSYVFDDARYVLLGVLEAVE